MTETTWKCLKQFRDMLKTEEFKDGVPAEEIRAMVSDMWPRAEAAAAELVAACLEVDRAEEDESAYAEIVLACEAHDLGALPEDWCGMKDLLVDAVHAVSAPAGDLLRGWLAQPADTSRKLFCVRMLIGLGDRAAANGPLFVAELADSGDPAERFTLRSACAVALGRLDLPSPEVVEVLSRVAADEGEYQPLRSYCIEALMDLGPAAAAAIPVLREIKDNDEDDDLRHFAWSALKSVSAASREHPCGGTVAEHLRSLYMGVQDEE